MSCNTPCNPPCHAFCLSLFLSLSLMANLCTFSPLFLLKVPKYLLLCTLFWSLFQYRHNLTLIDRIPATSCFTVGGPDPNRRCLFPFIHDVGLQYINSFPTYILINTKKNLCVWGSIVFLTFNILLLFKDVPNLIHEYLGISEIMNTTM